MLRQYRYLTAGGRLMTSGIPPATSSWERARASRPVAATTALLDKDQAQLDSDLANLISTRVVAAEAGTVMAVRASCRS